VANFQPDAAVIIDDSIARREASERVVSISLRATAAHLAGRTVFWSVARQLDDARAVVVRVVVTQGSVRRGGHAPELAFGVEKTATAVGAAAPCQVDRAGERASGARKIRPDSRCSRQARRVENERSQTAAFGRQTTRRFAERAERRLGASGVAASRQRYVRLSSIVNGDGFRRFRRGVAGVLTGPFAFNCDGWQKNERSGAREGT
jgi:hypothetical protein